MHLQTENLHAKLRRNSVVVAAKFDQPAATAAMALGDD